MSHVSWLLSELFGLGMIWGYLLRPAN